MSNPVVYFAIHADDCQRAKAFYQQVFGWKFEPWGPPDFWLIDTGEGGIRGALQQRREPLSGAGFRGYECSIAVEDVEAAASAVEEAGGQVLMPPTVIQTVGTLIQFQDTEGNIAGAMQYEEGVL